MPAILAAVTRLRLELMIYAVDRIEFGPREDFAMMQLRAMLTVALDARTGRDRVDALRAAARWAYYLIERRSTS